MTGLTSSGKAVTIKKAFSRETAISIDIQADKSIIWTLLSNAPDYPRWNSTVISIDGTITINGRIQLKTTLNPKRVFDLKVKGFEAESRLVWGDAMGERIYTLDPISDGLTNFSMREKIGGPIFPLFAKMIPAFDKSFEQFASDLKKEAERISYTR